MITNRPLHTFNDWFVPRADSIFKLTGVSLFTHLLTSFATMKSEDFETPFVEQRPSVLKTTASYIIATEFCERLAYYGFAGSLVLFFQTQLDYSNEEAVNAFYLWNGAVYVTPLLGGYVADTFLGRYKTILFFAIIYLFGLALFLFGSIPGGVNAGVVFTGMYVVALGAGGKYQPRTPSCW